MLGNPYCRGILVLVYAFAALVKTWVYPFYAIELHCVLLIEFSCWLFCHAFVCISGNYMVRLGVEL